VGGTAAGQAAYSPDHSVKPPGDTGT